MHMASVQAYVVAGVLRAFYKPGWITKWSGDGATRDRGGGVEAAIRRPGAGSVISEVLAGDVPSAWIEPQKPAAAPTILYMHGGGYTTGSLLHYTDLLGFFARGYGLSTLYVDYRLAPLHVFPAAVNDAVMAYRWLLESTPHKQIVFMGDSAGGGLAISALLAAREIGLPLPAAAAVLSPWTDLEGTGNSLITRKRADPMLKSPTDKPAGHVYLGGADPRNPLASPLYGDLRGFPPLLIQVGDNEILLDDARRLADRAREAGVDVTLHEWPGLFHVFPIFPSLIPEARAADKETAAFIFAHAKSVTHAPGGAADNASHA
jgi:acetyl esterase/lipase